MSEPNSPDPIRPDDGVDDERSDEDRDVSDVGLPRPGDDADAAAPDEAALDQVFPPEHG